MLHVVQARTQWGYYIILIGEDGSMALPGDMGSWKTAPGGQAVFGIGCLHTACGVEIWDRSGGSWAKAWGCYGQAGAGAPRELLETKKYWASPEELRFQNSWASPEDLSLFSLSKTGGGWKLSSSSVRSACRD